VLSLIAEGFDRWPNAMLDATGQVKMQCAVLHTAPSRKDAMKYALLRNVMATSGVESTYIDCMGSIQKARDAVSEDPTSPTNPKKLPYRKAVLEIMQYGSTSRLSVKTLTGDIKDQIDLSLWDLIEPIMQIAKSYGHAWFSRNGMTTLLRQKNPSFVFSIFNALLRNQSRDTASALTPMQKARFFRDMTEVVGPYYDHFDTTCQKEHKLMRRQGQCCIGDTATLNAVREAVLGATLMLAHDPSVIIQITDIVLSRNHTVLPPVPRLEGVPLPPPRTSGVGNVPKQKTGTSKKPTIPTVNLPDPRSPLGPTSFPSLPTPPPSPSVEVDFPVREVDGEDSEVHSEAQPTPTQPVVRQEDLSEVQPTPTHPVVCQGGMQLRERKRPPETEPKRHEQGRRGKRRKNLANEVVEDAVKNSSSDSESPFDDDTSKYDPFPVLALQSAAYQTFRRSQLQGWFDKPAFFCEPEEAGLLSQLYCNALKHSGYVVIQDNVRDDTFLTCAEVDQLFDFSRAAFASSDGKCCSLSKDTAFGGIFNTEMDGDEPSKRFQSNRHAYHQHLEDEHPDLFRIKLKLDISAAILGISLHLTHCRLPNSGGRLLLSDVGCPPQPPHCDYKVRVQNGGKVSSDCSYFLMQAGRDGMKVLVWPATHYELAWVDWAKTGARAFNKASNVVMSKAAMDKVVSSFWSQRKPTELVVPPYGIFLCRGDVVHAGAGHDGPQPNVRCHVHLTSPRDKTLNAVQIRPFGL
jgi:hypothetical protein